MRIPHRIIDCENSQEDAKCQPCIIDFKMKSFECELCKSCEKSLKRITQIKYYSTKINKLKRLPPNEHGYMLPHYTEEEEEEEEEEGKEEKKQQIKVGYGNCSKGFIEMNLGIYNKNRKVCKTCCNQNRRK